uniref:Reverse transcriptase domain-containing protein n=1 Tax=Angiostrongylus cantonensis TaxID=6313 RepID=A0A0K0D8B2_ANGCA
MEAFGSQGVPTQHVKILRELYKNFTTKISPFYSDITVHVKRRVRQDDTITPKLFTATLQNVMRTLEWDNMGVKMDGRQIHPLRFNEDIVLVTPDISQAERMLTDFDKACGKIWSSTKSKENDVHEERIGLVCPIHAQRNEYLRMLQLCLSRSGNQYDERLSSRAEQKETSGIYLGREINMMNDLAPELSRRKRAAWGAFKSIDHVVKRRKNT